MGHAERLEEVRDYYQVRDYVDVIKFAITQTSEHARMNRCELEERINEMPARSLLDFAISGMVRERFFEETGVGADRRYRVERSRTWLNRDEIERLVKSVIIQMARDTASSIWSRT